MRRLQDIRLVVVLDAGMSLRLWDRYGILGRETALYRRLRPRLAEIVLVTYGDRSDLDYADSLDGVGVICNRRGWKNRPYWWGVRWRARDWRGGATLIKTNQISGADAAIALAGTARAPLILRYGYPFATFMERSFGEDSRQVRSARDLEGRACAAASRVVVTSPAMQQAAIADYGLAPGKVDVVPNYVDTDLFRPTGDFRPMARRLCFVGRLDHQKNLFSLFEAIEGLDVELTVAGDGSLKEELSAFAEDKGLRVRWLGRIPHEELPAVMNDSDIFILPSHYEGHPKALLEAMSCGLPVIGTDVAGTSEVLRHLETGCLCGVSPAQLRAAIAPLLEDDSLRRHLGEKARRYVVDNFSLDRIVEKEAALLESVINGRARETS